MAKDISMNLRLVVILVLSAVYLSTCNDPTALGSELLDEDQANVGFTDTFTVEAYTTERDPVRVYSGFSGGQQINLLFGNFNDPVFGRSSSTINAQVFPINGNPGFLQNNGIDSVVLFLPYNVLGVYGNLEETYGMDVYELDERLRADEEYLSDFRAMTETELLGSYLEVPQFDSTDFIIYGGVDPDTLNIPYMGITLSTDLVDQFINFYEEDSTFFADDSLFLANFNGFQLQPTTENSGILNFDMFDDIGAAFAGLYVFYRDTADVRQSFRFTFSQGSTVASFPQYEHDISGSIAEPFVGGKGQARDSLLFIQGMSGIEATLELPPLDDLRGTIINKAELEFFIREFSSGDTIYSPSSPLVLTLRGEDGDLSLISDAQSAFDRGLPLAEVFGGIPSDAEDNPRKYTMNITAHIQDVIDGQEDNELVIIPLGKSSNPSRVVLYGATHPEFGIKLRIAYTEL
jgi:hypothetical protein